MNQAEALARLLRALERLEADVRRANSDPYEHVPSRIRHDVMALRKAADDFVRVYEAA
jgi:hypothetical protein